MVPDFPANGKVHLDPSQSTPANDVDAQSDIDRLTSAQQFLAWEDMIPEQQLGYILRDRDPDAWVKLPYLETIVQCWDDEVMRAQILVTWEGMRRQNKTLELAVYGYTAKLKELSSQLVRNYGEPVTPYETRGNDLSSLSSLSSQVERWPTLQPESLYGLAGDYVRAIAPHSEADPAAILVQFLATYGVVIGRNRYAQVEATRHYPNLFTVVAGLTSRARKGTSYGHIEMQMEAADCTWTRANHIKGVGSGEGLIYAVRDKRMGKEPVRERGRVVGYQEVEIDPGVEDKRGLYQTGEFSSILKVAAREGNTLSEVIRDIWDTGYLRNTTKGSPLAATDAHIGIIGHITIDEVQKLLTSTDMANGFANRFIWICARRSKELPEGGDISSVNFAPLLKRLHSAVTFGKGAGRMQRDDQAKAAWAAVYSMLSEDNTGLANTILARAEAQVLRLSILYALLDESSTIRHEHLHAALALWTYAEESAAYIFGQATGDEAADTLLSALEKAGEEGLTRKDITTHVLQGHKRSDEITRVLAALEARGRITCTQRARQGGGKGRGAEVYSLRQCELSELSELRSRRYLIASNDAAKSTDLSSQASRELSELRSQTPAEVPAATDPQTPADVVHDTPQVEPQPAVGPCAYTHFDPEENACLDCGMAFDPITRNPDEGF